MVFKYPLFQADDHDLQEDLKIHTLLSTIDSFQSDHLPLASLDPSGAQHLSFKVLCSPLC